MDPLALFVRHAPSPEGTFDVQLAAAKLFKLGTAGASQSDAPLRDGAAAPAEAAPTAATAAGQAGQGSGSAALQVPAFTPTSIRDDVGHMGWIAVGAGLPALLRLRARYNAELRSAVKGGSPT